MAVKAWYDQSIHFDFNTYQPKEGKTKEGTEFVQVVYQDTEKVGFGIIHPYVIGYYCPKASMNVEDLKKQIKKPPTPTAEEIAKAKAHEKAASGLADGAAKNTQDQADTKAEEGKQLAAGATASNTAADKAKSDEANMETLIKLLEIEEKKLKEKYDTSVKAAKEAKTAADKLVLDAAQAVIDSATKGTDAAKKNADDMGKKAADEMEKARVA